MADYIGKQEGKEKGTLLKDAFVLFAITLIAGVLLGFVYELTQDTIEEAKVKEKQEAYELVFQEAASFSDKEEKYVTVSKTSGDLLQVDAMIKGVTIDEILEAYSEDGTLLGYVMTTTSHEGYGGEVPITIGITIDGRITGVEVLDNSETSGFGSKAKEPAFKEQFKDMQVEQVVPGDNFDGISGATITTKAVTNAINGSLYYAKYHVIK